MQGGTRTLNWKFEKLKLEEKSKWVKLNFSGSLKPTLVMFGFVCNISLFEPAQALQTCLFVRLFHQSQHYWSAGIKNDSLYHLTGRSEAKKLHGKHKGLSVQTSCLLWAPSLRYPAQPLSLIHPLLSAGALSLSLSCKLWIWLSWKSAFSPGTIYLFDYITLTHAACFSPL